MSIKNLPGVGTVAWRAGQRMTYGWVDLTDSMQANCAGFVVVTTVDQTGSLKGPAVPRA